MALADALLAYGMRLYYSTDGSTYTELVDVTEMGPPGDPSAPDVDVTPLNPEAAVRQFKAGLSTSGEFEFKQHFTKARTTLLKGRYRLSTYWRIIFPDNATPANASKFEFQGFPNKVTTTAVSDPDDKILIDCKVKITTAITFTEGS